MNILVTGGCGFIGSHFIEYLLKNDPEAKVFNVDALTYAAHPDTPASLQKTAPSRYHFSQLDINSPEIGHLLKEKQIDTVVNFAAESHVDRSILDPGSFVRTNIVGVQNLLQATRLNPNARFVQVSTDEVYGSLKVEDPQFTEQSILSPNSPYAASKASADLLIHASFKTYGQDVVTTRCTNNYGPLQFPEKLIPLLIANALEDKPIPVYGDGMQIRDWIYVEDHVRGIDAVMRKGRAGEVYNISSHEERPNLELVKTLLAMLNKPESLITYVGDRPGHDRRYGLNAAKIEKELNWKPLYSFSEGMKKTVAWYLSNQEWWKKVRNQDFYKFYGKNYDGKMKEKQGARA